MFSRLFGKWCRKQATYSLRVHIFLWSIVYVCAVVVKATEDLLAFMIRHTSGVICASLEEDRLEVQYMCRAGLHESLDPFIVAC